MRLSHLSKRVCPSVVPSVGPSVGNAFVKIAKSVGKSSFSEVFIASVWERNIVHPLVHPLVHPSICLSVHWSIHLSNRQRVTTSKKSQNLLKNQVKSIASQLYNSMEKKNIHFIKRIMKRKLQWKAASLLVQTCWVQVGSPEATHGWPIPRGWGWGGQMLKNWFVWGYTTGS